MLVDQEFGVTDYVDEKDLSDLKLNLLLNLCRPDGEFYSVASEGSTSFFRRERGDDFFEARIAAEGVP